MFNRRELVEMDQLKEIIKRLRKEEKKSNKTWLWVLIGGLSLVAAGVFVWYKFFKDDYDYLDEFDDDEDDYYYDDDEDCCCCDDEECECDCEDDDCDCECDCEDDEADSCCCEEEASEESKSDSKDEEENK